MLWNILNNSRWYEVAAAVEYTSNCLHVNEEDVTAIVAVSYVVNHFVMGSLEGWEGFCEYTRLD